MVERDDVNKRADVYVDSINKDQLGRVHLIYDIPYDYEVYIHNDNQREDIMGSYLGSINIKRFGKNDGRRFGLGMVL